MNTLELSKTVSSSTETIHAVIIEDEDRGIANLQNLLAEHCPQVKVVGIARSNEEGKILFENLKVRPDVAFLDISLPDGLVFSLLDNLKPLSFEVIFVTAYGNHAIKACEYSSIGYVLKPINPNDLIEAVKRIRLHESRQMEQRLEVFKNQLQQPNTFDKMVVTTLDGYELISYSDIIRLSGEDNYTRIHLKGKEPILVSKTIKFFEEILENKNFFRVHKSHIINLNYISKVVRGDGGYVIMSDGVKIVIAKRRRTYFMEMLKSLGTGLA